MNTQIFGTSADYSRDEGGVHSAVYVDIPLASIPASLAATRLGGYVRLQGTVGDANVSAIAYPAENGLTYRRVVVALTDSLPVVSAVH